jgi:hypothetical protein
VTAPAIAPPRSILELILGPDELRSARAIRAARDEPDYSAPRFQFLSDEELENLPPLMWTVTGVLPRGALGVLFGPPGSYKTFCALDLALSIAVGMDWHGHLVERAPIVVVSAEGVGGMPQRVTSWKTAHGLVGRSVDASFVLQALNLMEVEEVETFIARLPTETGLIVLDTFARCIPGADENSASDVGRAIRSIDQIRAATGAAVLLIHHTRLDGDRERGSTALRGAADVMIQAKADNGSVTLSCEKMKDAELFTAITRAMVSSAQSLVMSRSDQLIPQGEILTQNERLGLTSLSLDFLAEGATFTEWQTACGVPRGSFPRMRTSLVVRGYAERYSSGRRERYRITSFGRAALGIEVRAGIREVSVQGSQSVSPPPLLGGDTPTLSTGGTVLTGEYAPLPDEPPW